MHLCTLYTTPPSLGLQKKESMSPVQQYAETLRSATTLLVTYFILTRGHFLFYVLFILVLHTCMYTHASL